MVFKFKLHYWPPFIAIWFTTTFIITYAISVSLGNVYWFFPYISDTGSIPPESCIFGQLLNMGAAFLAVVIYIRYREVEGAIDADFIRFSRKWNLAALWLGWISCLGMSLVANFQQVAQYVSIIHFFGALGAFGIASVYFMIQTRISYLYMTSPYGSLVCNFRVGPKLFYFRLFLTIFFLPLYFTCTIGGVISALRFTGDNSLYWTREDGGFEIRLAATFSEWILVAFELLYILTFMKEFRNIGYRRIHMECKYVKTNSMSTGI